MTLRGESCTALSGGLCRIAEGAYRIVTNGKQRVLQAMAGGKPDQIPIALSADWDYVVRAGGGDPYDWMYGGFDRRVELCVAAHRRHPGTALMRTGQGRRADEPRRLVEENGQRWLMDPGTGRREQLVPLGDPPWTEFAQAYARELGVVMDESAAEVVETRGDLERCMPPILSSAEFISRGYTERTEAVVDALGADTFIATGYFGLFPDARFSLGGFEEAMMALAGDTTLVEAVLDRHLARYLEEIEAYAQVGADGMWMRAYYEGADLVSPRTWRRVLFPRHKAFCDACHRHGTQAIIWFLGDCLPLVEDIAAAGYDLLYVEQGRRGYSSDPAEFRRRIGNDLCVTGWTWEHDMIADDRPAIAHTVREQIESAARDGAFIYGTTFLTAEVRPETVDFMCQEILNAGSALPSAA